MSYLRVCSASVESKSETAADNPIIELQIPTNVVAEIVRVEIGAAEGADPLAEVQELAFYLNDAASTAGTGLTENVLTGAATPSGVTLGDPTLGATPTEIWHTGFHWSVGYLYLPVPEERIRVTGGTATDNFGFYFPTAPDAATVFSATLVWGEIA